MPNPSETTAATATATNESPTQPLVIHPQVQWALATRSILHWVACVAYFAIVMFFSQWMYDPSQSLRDHLSSFLLDALNWLPAVFLLLPLVVFDMLKISQRIVSPVLSVRDGLQSLAKGESLETVPNEAGAEDESFFDDLLENYHDVVNQWTARGAAQSQDANSADSLEDHEPNPAEGPEIESSDKDSNDNNSNDTHPQAAAPTTAPQQGAEQTETPSNELQAAPDVDTVATAEEEEFAGQDTDQDAVAIESEQEKEEVPLAAGI